MTKRKKVPDATLSDVLTKSRRRCCICFGLLRDKRIKGGQIAHLDDDPSNNDPDNLAFLCLEHHALCHQTSRQSKNFTPDEVKKYRADLYVHFELLTTNESREHSAAFKDRIQEAQRKEQHIRDNLLSVNDGQRDILLRFIHKNTRQLSEFEIGGFQVLWFDDMRVLVSKRIIRSYGITGPYEIDPAYFDYLKEHYDPAAENLA